MLVIVPLALTQGQETSTSRTVVYKDFVDSLPPDIRKARSSLYEITAGRLDILKKDSNVAKMASSVSLLPREELPSGMSDTIAVGTVEQVRPFLTYSRGGIYRDCTIAVDEVISEKVPSELTRLSAEGRLKPRISVLLPGGTITLSDGQEFTHEVTGYGRDLEVGKRYVFFLWTRNRARSSFLIKSWELSNGGVLAMAPDDLAAEARGVSSYARMDVTRFLERVRQERAQTEPVQ